MPVPLEEHQLIARLVTTVDLDGGVNTGPRMSVRALHALELADGRRVVLLDDRGWGGSSSSPSTDLWASTSLDDVERTARTVLGPDEPLDGDTLDDAAVGHWAHLARQAEEAGVSVSAKALAALPHDVEVSDAVRARAGR